MSNHDAEFQGAYFSIEIKGVDLAFFTACSGLSMEFEVMEHPHINAKAKSKTITKIPGRSKYSEVVLKRGFTPDDKLYKWFKDVLDAATKTPYKDGSIVIYDREQTEVARFNLTNMWPSKLSVSDLTAGSDEVMVEEVTIQHEFIDWA